MGTEEAILYSYDFATVASVIPAFLKRDDVIVVDEACNHAVKTGAFLSRARVVFFRHNDMAHLEEVLKQVVSAGTKKPLNRRFIAIEGLYQNTGGASDGLSSLSLSLCRFLFCLSLCACESRSLYVAPLLLSLTALPLTGASISLCLARSPC